MTPDILTRLERLGIRVASQTSAYLLLIRENCLSVIHTRDSGALDVSSTGIMTDRGPAYLVWRDGQPRLATHGAETAAEQEQVEAIRKFSGDVKRALGLED